MTILLIFYEISKIAFHESPLKFVKMSKSQLCHPTQKKTISIEGSENKIEQVLMKWGLC